MSITELIKTAKLATERSYAPYSGFCVGAALLCADGKIFSGCNIENSAFSPTVCAERVAFFKAISEGYNNPDDFVAIAVVAKKDGNYRDFFPPCGVCRQVMLEFCDYTSFEIIIANESNHKSYKLSELIPQAFSPDRVARDKK